jgi:uncharacterized protein YaiI (UPF0178 family)
MQILVDADACPNVIKEILFRVAQRTHIQLTLVANQTLRGSALALYTLHSGSARLRCSG